MTDHTVIHQASLKLLEPYTISPDCPYLSDGQQELCRLPLEKRSEWMGEWLLTASLTDNPKGREPLNDTSPAAERIILEGYRSMPGYRKLRQVTALTQLAQRMALTRIREQYRPASEKEERLRLAALWLPRETMIRLFNWDPEEKGY
jgi:hypothetical protein